MANVPELLADLDAEYAALHALVADLPADASAWDRATPAEGWAVRDQISHLAFFDDAGRIAMVEPERFSTMVEDLLARGGDPMAEHLAKGRAMTGGAVLQWWEDAHSQMVEVFAAADPATRVPWFGPPMGVLSFVTARLMETWAHGNDVADALGCVLPPTDRLRHVAHLGVRARPFSYAVRGREAPPGRIDVVLTAPSGEEWQWQAGEDGANAAGGRVYGSALDFCLVVTQRRHLDDTALDVTGDAARDWMGIAQAFAGPPGAGRKPLRRN